jgi:Leucine-rich repeat (LRR) protein
MHRTAYILQLMCLAVLLGLTSCSREAPPQKSAIGEAASPTEPAFAQQAEAVRTGASDTIRLDKTLVTDQDLVQLDGLDGKLRRINLSQTELSDAALARLAKCTELEQLRIASPRFTNEGVALLAEMPKLKYLHLIDSPLTDEALPHLKKLTGLSSLYLDGTEISLNGMRELSEALPDTHKHFDGGHFRDDPRADVHEK